MKKYLLLFVAILALGITSCTETEVSNEELTTDVVFKPLASDDLTISKDKSDVNPAAFGPDFITIAISSMELTAEHDMSGETVSEIFNVVEDGSGVDAIQLSDVRLGWNTFYAATESYVETPETDPRGSESDGFSAWNKVKGFPFTGVEETSADVVGSLRALPPYVTFEGTAHQEVFFEGCEQGACNEVEMDMNANQGRLIVTVEFEDIELAHLFRAECKMTWAGDGAAPSVITDLDYTAGVNVPLAWFYFSNSSAVTGVQTDLNIKLRAKGDNSILRVWNISSIEMQDLIGLENGVDRWLKVTLTEEALLSNCSNFTFNWGWVDENGELDLGDCDGDGIPNSYDETPGCND